MASRKKSTGSMGLVIISILGVIFLGPVFLVCSILLGFVIAMKHDKG